MMKYRIAQLAVLLMLLLMGAFALQPGVTHASTLIGAPEPPGPPRDHPGPPRDHPGPPDHCYGRDCNGQYDRACYYRADSVQDRDYYSDDRGDRPSVIAHLSIMYSSRCGAYFARLETYVRVGYGSVSIERGRRYYSSRLDRGDETDSPLVGEGGPRSQISATGEFDHYGRHYSETIYY